MTVASKPDIGVPIISEGIASADFQVYLDELQEQLNTAITAVSDLETITADLQTQLDTVVGPQVDLTSYTALTLPTVTATPGLIFVTDETGGAVPAFSDGTNWRRVTDRAIVS